MQKQQVRYVKCDDVPHTHALCMTQDVVRYVKMRTGAAKGLERYKIVEICGLTGSCFLCKRKKFVFNTFLNFKPVKRSSERSDVTSFWSIENSAGKRVTNKRIAGFRKC